MKWKILLYIYLSVGIQMDTYRPIDRPVRMKISLEHDKKSSCVSERKLFVIYMYCYVLYKVLCVRVIQGCKNIYKSNFVQEFTCWSVRQPNHELLLRRHPI